MHLSGPPETEILSLAVDSIARQPTLFLDLSSDFFGTSQDPKDVSAR